jgi:NagD protein
MIGDTMETDILGAVQLGFHSILVLSGGTRREDLPRYAYKSERVVESVAALADCLEQTDGQPLWQALEEFSTGEIQDALMR